MYFSIALFTQYSFIILCGNNHTPSLHYYYRETLLTGISKEMIKKIELMGFQLSECFEILKDYNFDYNF